MPNQQRTFAIERVAATTPADDGLLWMAISSEEPYERWWGIEILDHSESAVDMSRIGDGRHPLLVNHRTDMQVGVMRQARLDPDRKVRCGAEFSKAQCAADIKRDVEDGIRTLVSVGYQIDEIIEQTTTKEGEKIERKFSFDEFETELQRRYGTADKPVSYRDGANAVKSKDDTPTVYRVTKWMPFEGSLVAIPADTTVGVGRSVGSELPAPVAIAAVPNPVSTPPQRMENTMPDPVVVDVKNVQEEARKGERERVREITAMAEKFNQRELGVKHVDAGTSIAEFGALLLKEIKPTAAVRVAEDPALGLTANEVKQFSFLRALNALANPGDRNAVNAAGFEREVSEAAAKKSGKSPQGILVPIDILSSRLMPHFGDAGQISVMARAMAWAMSQVRDLTVGTSTAGGHTVATDLLSGSFIELLRNRMALARLGATVMNGLNGNIAIPRQTGGATAYWVAESGAPTESQQAFDQVSMSPKTVGAFTDYSRKLLLQTSIDVESMVRRDLATVLGLEIDRVGLYGTGSSNQPRGVDQTSGINTVNFAAAAPTFAEIVSMETQVAADNADIGALKYLVNATGRGGMKTTEKATNTGQFIWEPGNTVNGYPCEVSNQVASGDFWFGNWADLLIGFWSGLDLMVDPYTGSTSGTVRVVALQDVDVAVRHPESFCNGADNP